MHEETDYFHPFAFASQPSNNDDDDDDNSFFFEEFGLLADRAVLEGIIVKR